MLEAGEGLSPLHEEHAAGEGPDVCCRRDVAGVQEHDLWGGVGCGSAGARVLVVEVAELDVHVAVLPCKQNVVWTEVLVLQVAHMQVPQAAGDVFADAELDAVGAGMACRHVPLQRDLHALHVHVAVGRDLQDPDEVVVLQGEEHVPRLHADVAARWLFLQSPDDGPVAHVEQRLCALKVV